MNNGIKIRLLRTAQGMRQIDLAERAGIEQKTISYLESGAAQRDEQKLLDTLGYTADMDSLLEGMAAATGNRGVGA